MFRSIQLALSHLLWGTAVSLTIVSYLIKCQNEIFNNIRVDLAYTWFCNLIEDYSIDLPRCEVDPNDEEWNAVKVLLPAIAKFYLLHVLIGRLPNIKLRMLLQSISSVVFLITCLPVHTVFYLILTYVLSISFVFLNSKLIPFIVFSYFTKVIVYDGLSNSGFYLTEEKDDFTMEEALSDICLSWACLRAISLTCDSIDRGVNILQSFHYYLYLPSLVTGPLINYKTFNCQTFYAKPPVKDVLLKAICYSIRIALWILSLEAIDHLMYPNATIINYHFIKENLNVLEFNGFCLVLMLRFYIKYAIIYGIAEIISELDGVSMTPRPKCTLRVTSGVHIWRTFDRGMYLWFIDYIYLPILSIVKNRIFASSFCFIFTMFWHNSLLNVALWSAFNLMVVVLEKWLFAKFSEINIIWRLFQIPLYFIAVGSNLLFLGGYEIGLDFLHQIFDIKVIPFIFLAANFACDVSNYHEDKDLKEMSLRKKKLKTL